MAPKFFRKLSALGVAASVAVVAIVASCSGAVVPQPVDLQAAALTVTVTKTVTRTATVTKTVTSTVTAAPPTGTDTTPPESTAPVSGTPTPASTTLASEITTPSSTAPPVSTAPPAQCAPGNAEGGSDPFGTCWPGPGNTGVPAGAPLTVVNGNVTYSTPGAVISGLDIRGCVTVAAPDVTIKNSKITCPASSGYYAVDYYQAGTARLTLQDDTISCANTNSTGVGEKFVTAVRLNISGCENGFDADSDVAVSDSYIHDLFQSAQAHTDGLQSAVGSNLTLDHSVWYANNGTSALIINNNPTGPHSANTSITRNLFAGGAYTVYCPRVSDTNYRVVDNVFSRKFYPTVGAYGPSSDCVDETWSGNTYADTGLPVPAG